MPRDGLASALSSVDIPEFSQPAVQNPESTSAGTDGFVVSRGPQLRPAGSGRRGSSRYDRRFLSRNALGDSGCRATPTPSLCSIRLESYGAQSRDWSAGRCHHSVDLVSIEGPAGRPSIVRPGISTTTSRRAPERRTQPDCDKRNSKRPGPSRDRIRVEPGCPAAPSRGKRRR